MSYFDDLVTELEKLPMSAWNALDGFLFDLVLFAKREHAELVAERDALRRELEALEWLIKGGHQHWIAYDNTTRIVVGHTGPDWQTVAAALGREPSP